jgi:hypothetical protein
MSNGCMCDQSPLVFPAGRLVACATQIPHCPAGRLVAHATKGPRFFLQAGWLHMRPKAPWCPAGQGLLAECVAGYRCSRRRSRSGVPVAAWLQASWRTAAFVYDGLQVAAGSG